MRRSHVIALVLCAVPLCVFAPALRAGFVEWDDPVLISRNPHLFPPLVSGLLWHWTHAHQGMYIPLVYTVWWGLIRLAGGAYPPLFHAANLLLHIGSVCLVYRILRRLVAGQWPAVAGAVLFAIHPLQVEAVAWATGMKDVLSGFLALAALDAYLCFAQTRVRLTYAAATALYFLALLAKPATAALPLIAWALQFAQGKSAARRAWAFLAPWAIAAAAVLLVAARVQPPPEVAPVSSGGRVLVAADALAFYLWKLVWPAALCMNYGRIPEVVLAPRFGGLALGQITWIVPVLMALAAAATRDRKWIAAALIFGLAPLPVLGLHPFEFQNFSTVADRYVYLAMLGPALALSLIIEKVSAARVPAVCVLGVLCALSFVQAGRWRDTEALYRQAVAVNPDNFRAHHNLGLALAERGDVIGAMAEYQAVIALHPQVAPEYRYVDDARAALGDFPAAVDYAGRLIALQPSLPPAERQDLAELRHWRAGIFLRWAATDPSHAAAARQAAAADLATRP
jgi:tetratricopeptide (TPR) repeat protein